VFERWCSEQGVSPLPASSETLARYLGHLADTGRKASTIRRARISICVIHSEHGFGRPDADEQVRVLERKIARSDSAAEQGAPPLLLPDLERMMHALGNTRRDERDRALLLLGFAGAFRSCELVALDPHHLMRTGYGLRVQVPLGGREQHVEIRRSRNALLCAVTAVERWLNRLCSVDGAVFRTVCGERVTSERLAPRAVSRAVQRAAARAQLSTEYSSSSLRSGLAASARAQGRSVRDIQVHGRWKDARSVQRYVQAAAVGGRRGYRSLTDNC
jgi:integrase